MRCTEVAGRPFPDGKFTCRDIGDRCRYLAQGFVGMKRLSLPLIIFILFGLSHGVLHAQSDTVSAQKIANQFCEVHNSGSFKALLPLLTPKTKSTLMMAHMVTTGLAPKPQQEFYRKFDQKWFPKIEKFIESESIDISSSSQWAAINDLSEWPLLDAYLSELTTLDAGRRSRPIYGNTNDIVVNGNRAKGTVSLRTNGGILAGLNGNSTTNIDAGSVSIFMVKLSGKWMICHENEYNGELDPPNLKSAK
jgi:hypothetical protein